MGGWEGNKERKDKNLQDAKAELEFLLVYPIVGFVTKQLHANSQVGVVQHFVSGNLYTHSSKKLRLSHKILTDCSYITCTVMILPFGQLPLSKHGRSRSLSLNKQSDRICTACRSVSILRGHTSTEKLFCLNVRVITASFLVSNV